MMFQSGLERIAYMRRPSVSWQSFELSEVKRVSMKTWWANVSADFGCHRGNRIDILTGGRPRMTDIRIGRRSLTLGHMMVREQNR